MTEWLNTAQGPEWCDCAGGVFLGPDLIAGHGAGEPVVEDAHLEVKKDTLVGVM